MNVQIEIPDEVFSPENKETSRQILEAVALEGYISKQLTAGQISRILGFRTRAEALEFLAKNEVAWVDYSSEDAERERNLLRELLP